MSRGWLDRPSDRTKRRLITQILRKSPPSRYSPSDDPKEVDFLTLRVRTADRSTDFYVTRLFNEWVEGEQLSSEKDRYVLPISIRLSDVESDLVEIRHYYGPITATFNGWQDYRIGSATALVERAYFLYRFRSFWGCRFIRFSKDRFDLLHRIVKLELDDAVEDNRNIYDNSLSTLTLYSRLYGDFVYGHPQYKRHYRKFNLLLESLIFEKALERKDNGKVSIGPTAMQILSDYEIAHRRHRDAVWQNWILITLTLVLIVATAIGPALVEAFRF